MIRHTKLTVLALAALLATACSTAAGPTGSPSASSAPATGSPTPPPSTSPTATTGPSGSPISLPNTAQVAAAGNGVVWMLVAQHLFLSTDRGQTWTERTWPPQAPNAVIAFISDRVGWRMEWGSPATQCQSEPVGLGTTTDGATTWRGLDGTGIAPAQCKENLAFVDAQRGYLTAYDPNSAPTIYRTTDGGKTWAGAKLPDPPGFTTKAGGVSLRPGPVADFGSVLYVSAVGNTGTKETTYDFASKDGGATWTFAGTAPDLPPGAHIVFLTPTRWLAPLAPAPWAETTDGGATWHPFQTDYAQAAPVSPQIAFGDAQTGYATVRGGLQRTTDGGAHWNALKTPGT